MSRGAWLRGAGLSGFLFLSLATPAHSSAAGDYVLCQASSLNAFNGAYSVDFLLSLKQEAGESVPESWTSSNAFWLYLSQLLLGPAPHMQKTLQEYYTLLFREAFDQPRVWQKTPFGFPADLLPEAEMDLPANCGERAAGKLRIRHAIRRSLRGEFVLYEYDAEALSSLKSTSSLQYSFVILHHWMEDYPVSEEAMVALNRTLHSQDFDDWSAERKRAYLEKLGFFSGSLPIGVCDRSGPIVTELQYRTRKECSRVDAADLARVEEMVIDWKDYADFDFRPGDFASLTGLKALTVTNAGNRLLSVDPDELKGLTQLRHLNLAGNGLTVLPTKMLSELVNLEEVDLSGNELVQIYRDTFRNTFVKQDTGRAIQLRISNNLQKKYDPFAHSYVYLVPGSFNGLEYVTELDLSRGHFDRIRSVVFDPLVRLEKLDLSGNDINDLSPTLRSSALGKVRILDIGGNPFTSLPETALDSLASLEQLKLNDCRLESFPGFIAKIRTLRYAEVCNRRWSPELINEAAVVLGSERPDLRVSICGKGWE